MQTLLKIKNMGGRWRCLAIVFLHQVKVDPGDWDDRNPHGCAPLHVSSVYLNSHSFKFTTLPRPVERGVSPYGPPLAIS